jgi:hypothetical protein
VALGRPLEGFGDAHNIAVGVDTRSSVGLAHRLAPSDSDNRREAPSHPCKPGRRAAPCQTAVAGLHQTVYKLRLADDPENGLHGADIPSLVDRVIIGPMGHQYGPSRIGFAQV